MIDIELLKNELKRDEGVKAKPYYDTVGKISIGVGRNLDDNGISEDEIDMLLLNDIAGVMFDLQKNFTWYEGLSPNRKRAVINMAFNLGISRFKKFKRMIRAIEKGCFKRAATEALDSKWSKQVGDRALRIAKMIEKG